MNTIVRATFLKTNSKHTFTSPRTYASKKLWMYFAFWRRKYYFIRPFFSSRAFKVAFFYILHIIHVEDVCDSHHSTNPTQVAHSANDVCEEKENRKKK
jgi:hypothetical protein